MKFLLVALACVAALAAIAAPAVAHQQALQPALLETGSTDDFDVRALIATNAAVDVSMLTESQAEAYHSALLAQTITAEGKSESQLQAEIAARAPSMWDEFKARFAKKYTSVVEEGKRYAAFVVNLARIAWNNAKAVLSRLPARLRVIHSHLVAYADRTATEFRALLGSKLPRNKRYPVAAKAPRGVIRQAGQPVRAFLETEVSINADADADDAADADAEVDVEAEMEAELDAEADMEAEVDAEAEAEGIKILDGQPCGNNGVCVKADICPAVGHTKQSGLCAGSNICCQRNAAPPPPPISTDFARNSGKTDAPVDCDFRKDSSPIKDQGSCGSCWSFSAVSTLEAAYRLKTGKSVPVLSTQQLVDCVPGGGPDKCQGGWPDEGLVWAGNNGGVVTEALYKYKAIGGTCKKTSEIKEYKGDIIKPKAVKYSIAPCWNGPCKQDENELGHQLSANGPITVGIDASELQFYKSGVIDSTSSDCSSDPQQLNHAVNIEGLGTDKTTGQRYWIMRNSWSADWGESGRFRLAFGANTCGVASVPVHIEM